MRTDVAIGTTMGGPLALRWHHWTLLGRLPEVASGQSLYSLLRARLPDPLGGTLDGRRYLS